MYSRAVAHQESVMLLIKWYMGVWSWGSCQTRIFPARNIVGKETGLRGRRTRGLVEGDVKFSARYLQTLSSVAQKTVHNETIRKKTANHAINSTNTRSVRKGIV